ncbi:DnaJ-like protein subfamily C member 9 [Nematocida sp. AWRm80]|nr:DnaJ-like protein subfamily C member 9 [Nematocida sp. AWRm80]
MNRKEAAKVLNCNTDDTIETIRERYKKLAMKYHPDRPNGNESLFIEVNKAYEILLNTEERETITKSKFDRFRAVYEGSSEEKQEILDLYKKYKGNLQKIVDNMLLGEDEQEERYKEIISHLIKEHKLPEYPKYKVSLLKNTRRQKRREKEAKAAEELAKQISQRETNRKQQWDEMIKRLEEKVENKPNRKQSQTKNIASEE